MRFELFIITLVALAACTNPKTPAAPADTDLIETDTDTDTDADSDVDTDTDTDTTTTPVQEELLVEWNTTLTDYTAEAGDENVVFGTFLFTSTTGNLINVGDVDISALVSNDRQAVFTVSNNGIIDAADHMIDCVLIDSLTEMPFAGPVGVDVNGRIEFNDNFGVSGPDAISLDLVCDLAEVAVSIEPSYLAIDILNGINVRAQDSNGDAATITMVAGNPPALAVALYGTGSLTVALIAPPAGDLIPGVGGCLHISNVFHTVETSVIDEISFDLVGDLDILAQVTLMYTDLAYAPYWANTWPAGGTVTFTGLNAAGATGHTMELCVEIYDYGPYVVGGETLQATLDVSSIVAYGTTSYRLITNITPAADIPGNVMSVPLP
jgi:hypothetical protein